jgi:single-strand DNA-binding protein
MADGLNKVMLLGNLGQDPELKMIGGGNAVLNLRLATTETYLDKSNTRQERTDWHTVTVWGKRAEALAKILTKGSQIFVEGRIQTRSYEKNGEKRYATDIVANNIILAGGRRGGEARDGDFGGGGGSGGGGGGGRSYGGGGGGGGRPPSREAPAQSEGGGGGGGIDDFGGGDAGGDDEIPF